MIKRWGLMILIAISAISCGKDSSNVPSVSVDFEAPLTDPRLSKLNSPGGAVMVSGYGVAGLIIYHEPDGTYAAYDRCSSYQPQNKCAVILDNTGFTVTDPCSGSKFSLLDGTPTKGPATKSLRVYTVSVSNFQIFVTN